MPSAEYDDTVRDLVERQTDNSRLSDSNRTMQQATWTQAKRADVPADQQSMGVAARQMEQNVGRLGSACSSVSKYRLN